MVLNEANNLDVSSYPLRTDGVRVVKAVRLECDIIHARIIARFITLSSLSIETDEIYCTFHLVNVLCFFSAAIKSMFQMKFTSKPMVDKY